MDYYTILAQRASLAASLTGLRVEAVRLSGDYSLYMSFHGEHALKLAAVPDMPYLHRIEKRFMPVRGARDWFPRKIAGADIVSIDITPGDRVLTFVFASGYRIVFEMTGRHANIIAIDDTGVIAGAVRKVTGRQSGVREITSGAEYISPPMREFPDLLWSPFQRLSRAVRSGADIATSLAQQVTSGSRLFAEEALSRADIDGTRSAASLDNDELGRLLACAADMADVCEKGGEGATIVRGADGLPRDVFPMRMTSSGSAGDYLENTDEAVRRYSLERERGLEMKQLRQSGLSALGREEKSLRNTKIKIERERGNATEPEELERTGNTIFASLHLLHRGMNSAALPDPYTGGECVVELDPTLDGPANAERFFERARKMKEAAHRAETRLAIIGQRLKEIADERAQLETLEDLKALREKASTLERRAPGSRNDDIDEPFPRRFRSATGLEIIVGRNDKENDELIRWAHKNDLWLHAQGVGGSHVILRLPKRDMHPDHHSVELAAAIAAYYSKSKTSSISPVVCTPLKYVVKRRGQGPGQVTYTREKVYFVEPGLPGSDKNAD